MTTRYLCVRTELVQAGHHQKRNRIYTETRQPRSAPSKAHRPNLAQMILLCLRQRCSPQTTILCSLWTPEKLPAQPKAEQSLGSPEITQLQATVMLKEYQDLQHHKTSTYLVGPHQVHPGLEEQKQGYSKPSFALFSRK